MKNVLITGATSFIGSSLVQKLLDKGYFVYAFVRINSKNNKNLPLHPNLSLIHADLSEISILLKTNIEIDAFFHFGWDGIGSIGRDDAGTQKLNIENTLNAIDISKKMGCKCFIVSGSQAEYGIVNGLISEKTPCNPISEYGRAKLEVFTKGSIRCLELGIKYLHLRIFSVYGKNDHEWTLISEVITKLLKDEDVKLSQCEQYWNFLYAEDAVDQIIALTEFITNSEDKKTEVYNIASNDTRILKEFTEEIKYITGSKGRLLYGEKTVPHVLSIQPDIRKLMKDINWTANVDFTQGIKSIINSKRNEN